MDNLMYTLVRSQLKFNEKLVDTFFVSKVGTGIPQVIKGVPGLGRVLKPDLTQLIDQQLRAYEREFKELKIHLFDEVLDLIATVERVLSKPGGHLLLAGRSGVGRRTAV